MRASPASRSSTGSSRSLGTSLSSARSAARWAIFVPDGVTRWRKARAGDVLRRLRERRHRRVEVRADDPLGAAEALERLQAQHVRPGRPLLVPEPREHELEVRRLDRRLALLVACGGPGAGGSDEHLPGLDLVEHGLDERRLDLDLLAGAASTRFQCSSGRSIASRAPRGRGARDAGGCRADRARGPRSGRAARARPRGSRAGSWPACRGAEARARAPRRTSPARRRAGGRGSTPRTGRGRRAAVRRSARATRRGRRRASRSAARVPSSGAIRLDRAADRLLQRSDAGRRRAPRAEDDDELRNALRVDARARLVAEVPDDAGVSSELLPTPLAP